jgi:GDP-4-dehydro-6-deoxy-D-mannose reductase
MRILMTGALGFVAPYVKSAILGGLSDTPQWLLSSHRAGVLPDGSVTTALDVTEAADVEALIRSFRPDVVIHLAGVTSLPAAAADSFGAWRVNVFGTLNLLHALIREVPGSVFLSVGTGLAYGESARNGRALTEEDRLEPQNDYGVTKAAADLAVGALADRGVRVLRFRPFNHTGPGQSEQFVIPSFIGQIARIEKGLQAPTMRVGNLEVARDFLDVQDVAACYAAALDKADTLESGTVLNIASGKDRTIRDMLTTMLSQAQVPISVEVDPGRMRAGELPSFIGDATKARRLLDWSPKVDFMETIGQMLAHARART